MKKQDSEKLWNTSISDFEEGDRITFHNIEQGVEKTYVVKTVKDNGDIELSYSNYNKPSAPIQ